MHPNHFISKYDWIETFNETSPMLRGPLSEFKYRISSKTLAIREILGIWGWKITSAPLSGSTGRQMSKLFLSSKICHLRSIILQSHWIWMDSRISKSIWKSISKALEIAVFWTSVQIPQYHLFFWKIGKNRLFRDHEICFRGGHYHYENFTPSLPKHFPHVHCLLELIAG